MHEIFESDSAKKQKRKRILQESLVHVLATCCAAGTRIYISTDVKDLAVDNRALLEASSHLDLVDDARSSNEGGEVVVETQSQRHSSATGRKKEEADTEEEDHASGWLHQSVLSVPSERELVCEQDWRPVWRACFVVNGGGGGSSSGSS